MRSLDLSVIAEAVSRPLSLRAVPQTGSTNDDLKAAAKNGAPEYSVLIADRQLAGRGRIGRTFVSASGLYMSVLLPVKKEVLPYLTHLAALAVCRALQETAAVTPCVKWVNDVFVNGKKVCGILAESVTVGESRRYVVGIGVNANTPPDAFPEELKEIAGSVIVDRTALAAAILNHLFSLAEQTPVEVIKKEYAERCFLVGTRVTVVKENSEREATVLGLSEGLGLLVRYDDNEKEELFSGEVRSIRVSR